MPSQLSMIHFTELTFPILKSVPPKLQGEYPHKGALVYHRAEAKPLLEVTREDGIWLKLQ